MTPIEERAVRFAQTFSFVNPTILRTEDAQDREVLRFGTPNSTAYGQVFIHMDYPENMLDQLSISDPKEQEVFKNFVEGGEELRVVCSATDIIHHEFLGIQFS